MLTSPAEISHVGWCICLTHKSSAASTFQTAWSQPPCLLTSTMALLMGVSQKSFFAYNIFFQQSSLLPISLPCLLINPWTMHMGRSPGSCYLPGCKGPYLPTHYGPAWWLLVEAGSLAPCGSQPTWWLLVAECGLWAEPFVPH